MVVARVITNKGKQFFFISDNHELDLIDLIVRNVEVRKKLT